MVSCLSLWVVEQVFLDLSFLKAVDTAHKYSVSQNHKNRISGENPHAFINILCSFAVA